MEKPKEFAPKKEEIPETSAALPRRPKIEEQRQTPDWDICLRKCLPVTNDAYTALAAGEEPCVGIMDNLQYRLGREVTGKILGFMPTFEFRSFLALAKENLPFIQLVCLNDDSFLVLSNLDVSAEEKMNTVICYDPMRNDRAGQKARMAQNFIEDRAARKKRSV